MEMESITIVTVLSVVRKKQMGKLRAPTWVTPRQFELIQYFAEGCTYSECASKMGISENTIAFMLSTILARTRCKSKNELICTFVQRLLQGLDNHQKYTRMELEKAYWDLHKQVDVSRLSDIELYNIVAKECLIDTETEHDV
jgi:DNA-binding CsgD family transcriptional regulator